MDDPVGELRVVSGVDFQLRNAPHQPLELNEAAYLLGFEDPNSFGRAFRAWEGVPPSDWRETHRTSTAM